MLSHMAKLFFAILALSLSRVNGQCTDVIPGLNITCPGTPGISITYPDVDHCSRYWECWECTATNLVCESPYLYDIEHGWCNSPEMVYCGDRDCDGRPCGTMPPTTVSPTPAVNFTCLVEEGFFPDEDNCIKYFECSEWVAYHRVCQKLDGGEQLFYKPENEWCDYYSNVNCGDRPICDEYDENCSTAPPPTYCQIQGETMCNSSGLLFEEGPCEQCFCSCIGAGSAGEVCCQPGLIFNPGLKQCDYPANVPTCM